MQCFFVVSPLPVLFCPHGAGINGPFFHCKVARHVTPPRPLTSRPFPGPSVAEVRRLLRPHSLASFLPSFLPPERTTINKTVGQNRLPVQHRRPRRHNNDVDRPTDGRSAGIGTSRSCRTRPRGLSSGPTVARHAVRTVMYLLPGTGRSGPGPDRTARTGRSRLLALNS